MTPLEAAKALAATEPHDYSSGICHFCDEFLATDGHAPDCPWLQMPQIVAALEAAERLIRTYRADHYEVTALSFKLDALDDALKIPT